MIIGLGVWGFQINWDWVLGFVIIVLHGVVGFGLGFVTVKLDWLL